MTSYSNNKPVLGSKSALKSKTIWGTAIGILPELVQGVNELLGTGVLPPQATVVLHVVGASLAFFGRVFATQKISTFKK